MTSEKMIYAIPYDIKELCKIGVITLHVQDIEPTKDTVGDTGIALSTLKTRIIQQKDVVFNATVSLWVDGAPVAYDCLGSCWYKSYNQFIQEPDGYFKDMIRNVEQDYLSQLKAKGIYQTV